MLGRRVYAPGYSGEEGQLSSVPICLCCAGETLADICRYTDTLLFVCVCVYVCACVKVSDKINYSGLGCRISFIIIHYASFLTILNNRLLSFWKHLGVSFNLNSLLLFKSQDLDTR